MALKILSFIAILVAISVPALAAPLTPEQEARVQAIDGQVFSPFCPGRLLQDCPSGAAKDLRDKIREQIAAGASDDQVFEFLYSTYGEELRAAPRAEGVGLLAWIAPGAFLIVGAIFLGVWLRARRAGAPTTLPEQPIDPRVEEAIEQELRRI